MFYSLQLGSTDLSDCKNWKAYSYYTSGWLQDLNFHNPLKNLSTILAEFQWNSTGVMENYCKITGTNGTSGIPLKFRWNSSSS